MAEYLFPKKPDETISIFIDWSRQLSLIDDITDFTLTVTSGTVTLSQEEKYSQFIRALVSGGADGETATIHCEITTRLGVQLNRDVMVPVAADVTAITPTTATKRTIVGMAFEEIGLAGYEFDATPEEQFSALRRLDVLMARWRTQSLDLGYNFPAQVGNGDLDDPSNIPDDALDAVVTTLALRIMPAIGKSMSAESNRAYAESMTALRAAYGSTIPIRELPHSTPRGAGAKPYGTWWPFVGGPDRR